MRGFLSILLLCVLSAASALAAPHSTLIPVKATHHRDQRVHRHRAHKAGKHPTPKRRRHGV